MRSPLFHGAEFRLKNQKKLAKKADNVGREVIKALRSEFNTPYVKFMDVGQRLFIEDVKGLKVFWTAPGGCIDTSTIQQEIFEVPTVEFGFHVMEQEDKFHDKKTWDRLTKIAKKRVVDEVTARLNALARSNGNNWSGVVFGVWPMDAKVLAYFEDDNFYFHVLMQIPAGGMVKT